MVVSMTVDVRLACSHSRDDGMNGSLASTPDAALADVMPWNQLPGGVKRVMQMLPLLKPPMPDPGTPMQLVHHDDVASAIALAATTSAPAGAYNLAGDGVVSILSLIHI